MIAGEGEQLYVAGTAGIFYLDKIDGNWRNIILFKENKYNFKFFRSTDYTIYFTNNNTLFRIDKSTKSIRSRLLNSYSNKKNVFRRRQNYIDGRKTF